MINIRSATIPTAFVLAPLAVSAAAVAALAAVPGSEVVWQIGAWSLALAALLLIAVLPITAYSLAKNPSARTWQRWLAFVLSTLYLAALVFGSIY